MALSHYLVLAVFFTLLSSDLITTVHSTGGPLDVSVEGSYFTQPLSHFDKYPNLSFQQYYLTIEYGWSKKNGPILVYFGGEAPVKAYVPNVPILNKAAPRLNALTLYIEHRFYGDSAPYGSPETALASPSVRSYLNAEETLADFASLIISLKANLSAHHSPVIVLGSFYTGILAAWFRLKYPEIAVGALASSAPMLFFQEPSPGKDYCSILTRDFEQLNPQCSNVIRQSWNTIDEIASHPNGLAVLGKTFNLCSGRILRGAHELKVILANVYSDAAQHNHNGPNNSWVEWICDSVLKASRNNNTLVGVAGVLSLMNGGQCLDHLDSGYGSPFKSFEAISQLAWNWQSCSEIPILKSCNGNNSIIPREAFHSRARHYKGCWRKYHMLPRRDWFWMDRSGHLDIKSGSNIIFSNGLMDPYSGLGILDNISDTIVAINAKEGSYCEDMTSGELTDRLINLMEKEISIFENWIKSSGAKKTNSRIHDLVLFLAIIYLSLQYT